MHELKHIRFSTSAFLLFAYMFQQLLYINIDSQSQTKLINGNNIGNSFSKGKKNLNIFGPSHCVWEASIEVLTLIFNANLTIYTVHKLTRLTLKWFESDMYNPYKSMTTIRFSQYLFLEVNLNIEFYV